MVRGFKIGKKGSSLERVKFNNNDISLLTRGDGTEVLLQLIEKDKLFYIYPSDNPEVMEFYLILSGEVICEVDNEKVVLGPQDYFSGKGLSGPIHFTTLSNVTLLWVTTEPIFDSVSNQISSLMDIVKKVELKDNYTYRHSDRVANNAVKIAKKMNLNTDQVNNINSASFLHDIGKINIPEDILNKSSFLTEEEFSIVKKHPVDGVEMIKGSNYEEILPIIEQHHERLNGSGYPYGLIGDQILLESRIIAVSDSFDAMTEDRPYRKAFEPQFAFDEIKRLVGTHYDKQVVEAFEEVLKDEGKIFPTSK